MFGLLESGSSQGVFGISFKGLLVGIFHLYSNFNRTFCKETLETLIRRRFLGQGVVHSVAHCIHHMMNAVCHEMGYAWVNEDGIT